jgi:hypothetical protein
MTNLPLKPMADVQKLTAILDKNLKTVDAYIKRRQEVTKAVQALEGQKDKKATESKDALMRQQIELEEELPQLLGRIRAVADHLSHALLNELYKDMIVAVAGINSVVNRLHIIRSTVGARCNAQATIADTVIPSFVDGRDLFKPPIQIDLTEGHVVEAAWEQDDSAVALHSLLQPYHGTERHLEQLYFEQREAAAARRRGGGGFNSKTNSMMRPVWGFTHPWPKVDRGESYELRNLFSPAIHSLRAQPTQE